MPENESARRARSRPAEVPVFPFIVGCPRSGTTLLRAMLNSHPALAIPDESHFLAALSRRYRRRRFETSRGLDVAGLLDVLNQSHHFRDWDLPPDEVDRTLTMPPATDVADAIRRIYALAAHRYGKPRYADKTPAYVVAVLPLARMFPEARFVHIVRDGRDVALSNLAITEWGPDNLTDAALLWKRSVSAGRKAGRRLGARRYLEITYEHLVDDPELVLRGVCTFVALDFDDRMLEFSARADTILASIRNPHQHERLRQAPMPGLRDWRRDMAPGDVVTFEALAGRMLSELGYERACDPVPPRERARVAGLALQANARDVRARARVLRRQATNGRAWAQLARAVTGRPDEGG